MIKKILILLLTVLILSGCASRNEINNRNNYDIRNKISNYELYSSDDLELVIIPNSRIHWLKLSLDDYANTRNEIQSYENELIKDLEKINPQRLPLTIAIDKHDLNNDGIDEIIAFHNGGGGAKDAGILMVYTQDSNESSIINSIQIVGVPDIDILNDQGLGVIQKEEGTLDFIILNKLYIWDGTNWN